MGANIRVLAPTGDYENDELINLGSNRWATRAELGVSRNLGNWTVEAAGNIWIYGDNDDFLGGKTLAQDNMYVIKSHLIYSFRPGFWFGLGLGYGEGGRTRAEYLDQAARWGVFPKHPHLTVTRPQITSIRPLGELRTA